MIVSVFGNLKEIVALLPVKNPDADFVTEKWCELVKLIQESGLLVVASLTDNLRLNGKMNDTLVEKFKSDTVIRFRQAAPLGCQNELVVISNPQFPQQPIFLLYDSVHLLKCIRNNWINQRNGVQGFIYPSLENVSLSKEETVYSPILSEEVQMVTSSVGEDHLILTSPYVDKTVLITNILQQEHSYTVPSYRYMEDVQLSPKPAYQEHSDISESPMEQACFQFLVELYLAEKDNILKLAPSLCYQAIYPTSVERQKVSLALRIFNEKTIAALKFLQRGVKHQQTAHFLLLILNWWRIFNVTSLNKGPQTRVQLSQPFTKVTDRRFCYLEEFCVWLRKWHKSRKVYTSGCLTTDTLSALLQTTCTMAGLLKYLLVAYPGKFILTKKIQSDGIEGRFGLYRRLSGCNYHVSVQQILESEKLRIMSLLKLHSEKYGDISVKDILSDVQSVTISASALLEIPPVFMNVISEPDIFISYATQRILVYVAGYVGSKKLPKLICASCRFSVCIEKDLNAFSVVMDNVQEYISILDRGGLKYPSQLGTELAIKCHSLFNVLISEKYETEFLQQHNQKELYMSIVRKAIVTDRQFQLKTCHCGKNRQELLLDLVPTYANIFLNNYSKVKSDSSVHDEKEKKKNNTESSIHDTKRRKIKTLQHC